MPLFKGLASKLYFKMTMMSMDETSDLMSQAEWCPVLVVSLFQGYSFFFSINPPGRGGGVQKRNREKQKGCYYLLNTLSFLSQRRDIRKKEGRETIFIFKCVKEREKGKDISKKKYN